MVTYQGITIVKKYKRCFSTSTREWFWVEILRLSLADLYNHFMNSVDIGDQLRNVYRPDGLWMRLRKWWWSIFLWCMGQSVVNGYLVYKRVCEKAGKQPMTHLDFHVAVATAWCKMPKLVLEPKRP